jgi:cyanuric acid amidohydrolase
MSLVLDVVRPASPGDASGLVKVLRQLPAGRVRRVAAFGKTEGPATLNDYSRDLAQAAFENAVREAGPDLLDRTWRLFSTGCEGIASPMTAIVTDIADTTQSDTVGLAMGAARSKAVPPELRCGRAHVDMAAETVRQAMRAGGLAADQVALVLIKSPVLSPNDAGRVPGPLARHAGSTGSARGAAALGGGVALDQIDMAALGDDPVGQMPAFARNVMSFSGTETDSIEAIVFGVRPGGDGRWCIASAHLDDLLDVEGVAKVKEATQGAPKLVFFKAGVPPSGYLRGRRTTVLTSDLPPDKQLRAAASGVVAAHFGMVDAFISAGAEHQGAPGSSFCAVISDARPDR